MRYLNKALLTFSQIYNVGWWKSAKLTVSVLMSDVLMVAIMTGITNFVIFLSKLVVASIATLGFIAHIRSGEETSGWIIPAFIVFFLSYIVAAFLLGMFTNIIDIIFVCYQSDLDLTAHGSIRALYIEGTDLKEKVDELESSAATNTKVGDITRP
jgi:predicted membrane protein